jgi:hypothetical protein
MITPWIPWSPSTSPPVHEKATGGSRRRTNSDVLVEEELLAGGVR